LSTGAVGFFIHVVVQGQTAAVPTSVLILASLCFGFSALQCITALAKIAALKATVRADTWKGDSVAQVLAGGAKQSVSDTETAVRRMDRGFSLGIIFSVIFLIAQFVCTLKH
jgi:hypothetical protein